MIFSSNYSTDSLHPQSTGRNWCFEKRISAFKELYVHQRIHSLYGDLYVAFFGQKRRLSNSISVFSDIYVGLFLLVCQI